MWSWPEEHINIKEGRASLMLLRRHTRTVRCHRCRLLQFSDNLVSVCAFEKGRSKSWALNTLCRRSAAYQVACTVRWRLRHLVSARNPADAGSRRHEHRVVSNGCQSDPSTPAFPSALPASAPPFERRTLLREESLPASAGPVPIEKRRPSVPRESKIFL